MARFRYAACMDCRSEAQKVVGITKRQLDGLSLGREKGTNHRTGYTHKEESKQKIGASNKKFWSENPVKALERGEKCRGANNYNWKGGTTDINRAIRLTNNNRKWADGIRARDEKCVRCGNKENLESHHLLGMAEIIEQHSIKTTDDARQCSVLWDLDNGITLCQTCHYREHGRERHDN